jgi:hypothetical protein
MPFGLKGAPPSFSRLMTTVFSGLQGIKCLVYLDNIIIFGESLEIDNEKLREVLARFRIHNLKLQPDKCEFLRKQVTFFGHVVTENGVKPDEKKIEVVKHFPVPKCTRELTSF